MLDLKTLDQALGQYVRPATFPLAIQMVEREADLDPKARRPRRDLGIQVTICQAIGMARRYGWALAVTPEDLNCPLIFIPFGFAAPVPFSEQGHACAGLYTATPEAGARSETVVPRLPRGKYRGIQMAPLNRTSFTPDVICVYGNSAQVMRLVQGALWHEGGALTSLSAGRIDCAEIIIRTLLAGQPHYILPCSGDRIFGLAEDDEMIFAMPWSAAERVVDGLKGTHQGGIRYPVPKFMRYVPQYPDSYEQLRQELLRSEAESGE
ncbi:MAG: DUF169 domain-containing protein [Chloroflexi bacterium]|nr:DUF169 domain-containing protein [Chloroflexota bacterium]